MGFSLLSNGPESTPITLETSLTAQISVQERVKLDVTKIVQNGKEVFVGVMKASDLFRDQVKVESWLPGKPRAYQRVLRDQKVSKIARFVSKSEGIMPTSVLLSVRDLGDGGFHQYKGTSQGILEIPDDKELFVVDGQHRIAGLRRAVKEYGADALESYPLPVVIMVPTLWRKVADPEIEEGKQFITINKTQTGVKGDVIDVILLALTTIKKAEAARTGLPEDVVEMIDPRVRMLMVALILNSLPSWSNLITRPNTPRGDTVVGQKAMVDSFKFVNSKDYLAGFPSVGPLAINISHYWEALRDYYPLAAAQPKQYWLQKRFGVYVFHRLFPIFDKLTTDKSKNGYAAVLVSAMMKPQDYWGKFGEARTKGTGLATIAAVVQEIWPT